MRFTSAFALCLICFSAALGQPREPGQTGQGTPAASAPAFDPAEVRALALNYELASTDGARKCPITLEARRVGPGFGLAYDRAQCTQLFQFLGEVAAWSPGIAGAILLLNAGGRIVAEFTEGVGGVYEAIREGDAVYFLANLQFVDPAARPQITDLYGDWVLSRPGAQPLCRITLTEDAAGEGVFAVRLHPGCDEAVTRFGSVSWRMERGDVVLLSQRGETLRFGLQDGVWTKVPEVPRPLVMTRP